MNHKNRGWLSSSLRREHGDRLSTRASRERSPRKEGCAANHPLNTPIDALPVNLAGGNATIRPDCSGTPYDDHRLIPGDATLAGGPYTGSVDSGTIVTTD